MRGVRALRASLGSIASEKKGKEIPCIKELLDEICLVNGDLVTIDAIGCQKDIVKKIHKKKADYLIALKENQGNLRDETENFFAQAEKSIEYAPCNLIRLENKRKGNLEIHEIWVSENLEWLPAKSEWPGLKNIVMVKREWFSKGKKKKEARYYITSLCESCTELGERVRRHWSIENEYHWHLDVTFGEDSSLISGKANRNLRVAREISLQLLRRDKSKQMGIKRKMRRCARSDAYFQDILSGSF